MNLSLMALAGLMASVAITAIGQSSSVPAEARASSSSATSASADAAPGLHERNPRYQLRKGDTFDLDLAFSPELNQTVAVQPDGYVTLKGVGTIYVEGQTIPELTESLKAAYSKTLHDPELNQTVTVHPYRYVTLTGVGTVDVEGQTTPELPESLKAAYSKTPHDPVI